MLDPYSLDPACLLQAGLRIAFTELAGIIISAGGNDNGRIDKFR